MMGLDECIRQDAACISQSSLASSKPFGMAEKLERLWLIMPQSLVNEMCHCKAGQQYLGKQLHEEFAMFQLITF